MAHIQIRNVPEDVHRRLKVKAANEGRTLSDYLLDEIKELANTLTIDELQERIRALPPVESHVSGADLVREAREERERELRDRGR